MKKLYFVMALLIVAAFVLTACGGTATAQVNGSGVPVDSTTPEPKAPIEIYVHLNVDGQTSNISVFLNYLPLAKRPGKVVLITEDKEEFDINVSTETPNVKLNIESMIGDEGTPKIRVDGTEYELVPQMQPDPNFWIFVVTEEGMKK